MDYLELLDYMSAETLIRELEVYFTTDEWNSALEWIARMGSISEDMREE